MLKPYYSHAGITIYHGDCREILPQLQPVDLVLTDPPYGIPAGSAIVRRQDDIEDWGEAVHNVSVEGWLPLVNIKQGYLLEFTRNHPEALEMLISRHRDCGFVPWHFCTIVKSAPPPTPRPKFATAFEQALVSYKGDRQWYGGGYTLDSWIGLTPNQLRQAVHPTQKPIDPIRMWLNALCPKCGIVLDPFLGSGTTLRAAKDLGLRAIGIEVEEAHCYSAVVRLGQNVIDMTGNTNSSESEMPETEYGTLRNQRPVTPSLLDLIG